MKHSIVILVLFFVLAAIATGAYFVFAFNYFLPPPSNPGKKVSVENEIYAVFLEDVYEKPVGRTSEFLTIDGGIPPYGLRRDLAGLGMVFRVGEVSYDPFKHGSVFPGIVYELYKVEWLSGRSVAVKSRIVKRGSVTACAHTLEKKWGRWVIVGRTLSETFRRPRRGIYGNSQGFPASNK